MNQWHKQFGRLRVGSQVPVEEVHPQLGSYLSIGIIVGWIRNGTPCARKVATGAMVESIGRRTGPWDDWAEDNAWVLDPFDDEDQWDEQHVNDRKKVA